MGVRRAAKPIADADIPALIARDGETTAAIEAHTDADDPHPVYLTQAEGDGLYRRSAVELTDADIPALIARDSETKAAIEAHTDADDPHPVYLTQVEGDGRYRNFGSQTFTGSVRAVGRSSGTIVSEPDNGGFEV